MKIKSISSSVLMAGSLLLWSETSRAASYYVATTGSDSNPGTSASPFLTVQKGVNAASAGDTIIVENGTYLGCKGGTVGSGDQVLINKGGTAGAPITLQAQNPGGAILDGQNICHDIIQFSGSSSNWWRIIGFDMRNAYWEGILVALGGGGGNNILIQGNTIHNIGNRYNNNSNAITAMYTAPGETNVTINGNLFHDNGPTSVGSLDAGVHDHQLYIHGVNVNITNNVFYNTYNGYSIKLGSSNGPANYGYSGTVANNTFYGPDMYTGTLYSGQIYLDVDAVSAADTHPTIANNIFYYTRAAALSGNWHWMVSANNCTLNNNIVYDPPGTPNAGSAGIATTVPGSCVISNNKLNVDPKLTNPSVTPYASSNFLLLAGSPAIGAGAALALVPLDFNGASRAARNDIGAFQYGGTATAAALAITAASATGIGASSATIAWTTNAAADGQVVYGLTSAYGSATTLNTTLATSHSVALSGLTAGTVYHYSIKSRDSAGNLTTTPDATFTTSAAVGTTLPVISAISATSIGQTATTIVWTTNIAAYDQVVYGLTTAYNLATTMSTALTTSHSAVLSGLTAGTVYHYAVKSRDSAGNLATSPDATFTTTSAGTTAPGCMTSAAAWQNGALAAQTGSFTAEFDATPSISNLDGVIGISNGAAAIYGALAATVRFNNTGKIDAGNGGDGTPIYAAAASIPYVGGMSYHFRLVVNLPTHTYSSYVRQGLNAEQLIGGNYAFRSEESSVSTLNNLAMYTSAGSVLVCNAAATASAATVISAVSTSGVGQTVATIVWTTNNAADTQVKYGLTSAYGTTPPVNTLPVTSHSVALGGLTAGTVYHFQVMSRDAAGNLVTSPDATFTTAGAAITPPPVVSAVSATGLSASAATVGWTTDKPADSQVVYGASSGIVTVIPAGAVYPSASTLNATLTTSHSVPLSGLTAGTVYHYAVKSRDSAGNLATSPDATFTTTANITPPPNITPTACVTSGAAWQNVPLAAQTGSFTAEFDATPSNTKVDGVNGITNGAASTYGALAVTVRFNNVGKIDATNGGDGTPIYAAAASIPYSAGLPYHFRLVINLPAHTYSAYVKQGSNAELLIGSNYAFRTEEKTVATLNNLGMYTSGGTQTICNATAHF